MKIEEQTKVEIQQALGHVVPEPSDPGFAAFYSRLETEHPALASQLLAGLQHSEGEGGDTDSRAFFPEQEAQMRTRSQARNVMQRLFYRQDDLTDEWTVSKGKIGMAGLVGVCALLIPTLLVGAGGSATPPATAVAQKPLPAVTQPTSQPPPVTPPTVAVPPDQLPLPPVAEAPLPAEPSLPAEPPVALPEAPLPPVNEPVPVAPPMQVAAPPTPLPPLEQPRLPAPVPMPEPVPAAAVMYKSAAQAPPPGGSIYKGKPPTSASTTLFAAQSRQGAGGKDQTNGNSGPGGSQTSSGDTNDLILFNDNGDVNPGQGLEMGIEQTPGASKPGDAKPTDSKPIDTKPTDSKPSEPVSGPQNAAPTPPPAPKAVALYPVGTSLKAELTTGLIVSQGNRAMPILARSESGAVFSGLATLAAAGRVEIVFTGVLIDGRLEPIYARAYDPGGLPGLPVRTQDVAPTLAADLTRAAASGVAGYVQGLGEQTTTTTEGRTKTVTTAQPTLGATIAGAIANLFSAPPTQKALERIAQIDRGTPLLVTVVGEVAPSPSSQAP